MHREEPALELLLHPKCNDSQLPELEDQSPVPIKLKSCFCCVFEAPSQPPGNVVWNVTDSRVILSWEEVRAMDNESEVTGYKVSGDRAGSRAGIPLSVCMFRGCSGAPLSHVTGLSFSGILNHILTVFHH